MKLNDGDPVEITHLVNYLRECTCLKKKCMRTLNNMEMEEIMSVSTQFASLSLKSLIAYFDEISHQSKDSYHFSCSIEMLHLLYKDFVIKDNFTSSEIENTDYFLESLIVLSKKCLDQPDLLVPVPVDTECESAKIYDEIIQKNISVTSACFQFYLDIFFTQLKRDGTRQINIDESRINFVEEPFSSQKVLLKKSASKSFILACSRLGEQPWTNTELRKLSYDVVQCVKSCSKHDSYSSLLAGVNEKSNAILFQNGLLSNILDELMPVCHKENWKKNIPNMHALLWCLKKVTFPYLGPHVAKLAPPLLLLTDDYITDHKLLGILSLTHLIENVNPADLRLYNHADVIYDALMLQLFSNQGNIYEVTLACLLKLLPVIQSKPNIINGITYTCWDSTFVKLIENIDLTSKMSTELVLLSFIPKFIDRMGGNTIKHLDRIVDLVSLPIQGDGDAVTKKRLVTLKILFTTIQSCWPVMHMFQQKMFKIILRMLIDVCMASSMGQNSQKEIVEKEIYNVLVLLKLCCPSEADVILSSIVDTTLDSRFDSVKLIVKRVIETKDYGKS